MKAAEKALEERPNKEDWRDIRFSDEWHAMCGQSRQVHVIRRPGERYCPACIQEEQIPARKDDSRFTAHFWGAIGYNFKSELIQYDVPSNDNGKMT